MEDSRAVLHKPVVLLGIKHCGKSTHGKLLAKKCDCPFYDLDDEITANTGKSPRELYVQGVDVFMQAEYDACVQLLDRIGDQACVISSGGGICNNAKALEVLHTKCAFIFMNVAEEVPALRIVREAVPNPDGGYTNLPAYIAKENPYSLDEVRAIFHRFYLDRCKKYKAITDYTITLPAQSKSDNNALLMNALRKQQIVLA